MDPLVSVIIPVYKVAHYLEECIRSVCRQTYNHIEIILVDDGSPDGCGQLCDCYAAKDQRIVVVHKQNGGLSSARNAGMDVCKGEYISFVDSDDIVAPVFIEAMVTAAMKYDADVTALALSVNFWDGETVPKLDDRLDQVSMEEIAPDLALSRMFYQKNPTGAPFKLYKREIFQKLRFPYGYLYEDLATTYITFMMSSRMALVNGRLYAYRMRTDGIIRQEFSEKKMVIIPICRQLIGDISKKKPGCLRAAKSRAFAALYSVFLQVPWENAQHRNLLWKEIKKHRTAVLTDANTMMRAKNRFAAWSSFLGKNISWFLGRKFAQMDFSR